MEQLTMQLEHVALQQQRLEVVGRLAGGVAHDFNNLLTVIIGSAELAAGEVEQLADDEGATTILPLLAQIRDASLRGKDLAHHLLAFAAGRATNSAPVDLDEKLQALAPLLRRMIGDQFELVIESEPDVPPVVVDQVLVHQLVMNLVVNARDAMSNGGKITVSTGVNTSAGEERSLARHVELAVSDPGAGMDTETVAQLVEPFFTTKGTRGTGLGLTIVHDIVRSWGGDVAIDSRVGVGTTVRVTLPTERVTMVEVPSFAVDESARLARRVLLVEDADDVREVAARVLEHLGYDVETAASPDAALDLAARRAFACVITDVEMPGMSGSVLVDRLREGQPALKALLISGYAEGSHAWSRSEGTQFLAKPFDSASLAASLDMLLAGRP